MTMSDHLSDRPIIRASGVALRKAPESCPIGFRGHSAGLPEMSPQRVDAPETASPGDRPGRRAVRLQQLLGPADPLVTHPGAADRERIGAMVVAGLLAGVAGVAVLSRPSRAGSAPATVVALAGAACWGLGTVHAGHAPRPAHALQASAMEMLAAGAALTVPAVLSGEPGRIHLTGRPVTALACLIVYGSIVACSAYTWLLDHVPPRVTGTYAFVNPVVAVLLGAWLLGEPIGAREWIATVMIAAGVALIVLAPPVTSSVNSRYRRGETTHSGGRRRGGRARGGHLRLPAPAARVRPDHPERADRRRTA